MIKSILDAPNHLTTISATSLTVVIGAVL